MSVLRSNDDRGDFAIEAAVIAPVLFFLMFAGLLVAGRSIQARNQAESAAHQTEKVLKENEDKVSADTKSKLDGLVEGIREALKTDDDDTIKAALEALTTAMQAAGEEIYAQGGDAEGAPEGAAGDAGETAGDAGADEAKAEDDGEVIDADYEMVDDEKK